MCRQNPEQNEFVKYFNEKDFSKLNIDKMGNALSSILLYVNPQKCSLMYSFRNLLHRIFKDANEVEIKGDGEIVCCFTPSYVERIDFRDDMKRVANITNNCIAFYSSDRFLFRFKRLLFSFRCIQWLNQLKDMNSSFAYKLLCVSYILQGYIYRYEINEVLKKKNISPKLLLTFCDVHVADYFITEDFNKKGIDTATLQHAVFSHITAPFANNFSTSKYFLGISEFAKNEFIKSGANGDKFLVVGSMKYIGTILNEKLIIPNNKYIGVTLSGPTLQMENEILLKYAERVALKFGVIALIRPHPALNEEQFLKYINFDVMRLDNSNKLDSFADKCDYCLMGSTNTFGELVSNGHLAYRMVLETDVFEGIDDFKFSNYEQLEELIIISKNDTEDLERRFINVQKVLSVVGDIRGNYSNFFRRYSDE